MAIKGFLGGGSCTIKIVIGPDMLMQCYSPDAVKAEFTTPFYEILYKIFTVYNNLSFICW